jgi:penicillin G amidase
MRKLLLGMMAVLLVATSLVAKQSKSPTIEKLSVGHETVIILRDQYGVPRVFAQTLHGLFVGDSYAAAEDRAWQMEKYRLDAEGRLAEVFGKEFLGHDKEVRRDSLTRQELKAQFNRLPPRIRETLSSYAEGVNRYYAAARRHGGLNGEFAKYHVKPEPWSVEDTMAIGAMMAQRFGGSGIDQLGNEALVDYLEKKTGTQEAAREVFDDLGYENDPAALTTIGQTLEGRADQTSITLPLPPITRWKSSHPATAAFLLKLQGKMNSDSVYAAAHRLGLATKWGSYCWVFAPGKTSAGHAILLGGPQMGFQTPQIAHEIQLTGAGFNVIGMGFAGIPGVLIGMNDHLAWTTTSGSSHNEDVFVEKLKLGDPHRYLYRGSYRAMEHRVERILVKDEPPVQYDVYRTVHGPVVSWSSQHDVAYSKAMTFFGNEYGTTLIAFLGFNTARRIEDIPPLAAKISSSHNIFVATRDGDIGYWHCGFFPVYPKGVDPRFPLRGTGENDWKGFIPFDDLPQEINPKSGVIFNWNNKPAPGWINYSVPAWGIAYRISNIRNAIAHRLQANGGKISFTEALKLAPEIGRDNYKADWLKPGLLRAASEAEAKLSPEELQAIHYLRYWDNRFTDGSIGQTIFQTWYEQLRRDIFGELLGGLTELGGFSKQEIFDNFADASAVYHVLAGRQSSVPVAWDYLQGRSANEVRLKALSEALAELRRKQGDDMSQWGYHTEWIDFKPLRSIPWYSRGTYIQEVELTDPAPHGVWILPPGESENPHSPHYDDQLLLASWWMFAPMKLMPPPVKGEPVPAKTPSAP